MFVQTNDLEYCLLSPFNKSRFLAKKTIPVSIKSICIFLALAKCNLLENSFRAQHYLFS